MFCRELHWQNLPLASEPLMPQASVLLALSLSFDLVFASWELYGGISGPYVACLSFWRVNAVGNLIHHAIVMGLWRWRGACHCRSCVLFHLPVCVCEMKWFRVKYLGSSVPLKWSLDRADPSLDWFTYAYSRLSRDLVCWNQKMHSVF